MKKKKKNYHTYIVLHRMPHRSIDITNRAGTSRHITDHENELCQCWTVVVTVRDWKAISLRLTSDKPLWGEGRKRN